MKYCLVIGVILTFATSAWSSTYLRPQVAYVVPEEDGADTTVGGFLALGYARAGHAQHEFELEVGWAQWDLDDSGSELGFDYTGSADYEITPLLVNYRFSTSVMEKTRAYLQMGAGVSRVATSWDILAEDGEGAINVIGDDSNTVAAFAIGIGLSWQLGEKTSFNLGYRYLKLATLDVEITDVDTVSIDNAGAHIGELGLSFRF